MGKLKKPFVSVAVLSGIIIACVLADVIAPGNATRMDFEVLSSPPSRTYPFGTDQLGRDLFKMIFHGGRVSIFIGLVASFISAAIAIVYGTIAGFAPKMLDNLLMRFTELVMSVPSILYVISFQGIMGKPSALTLSVAIGVTSWMTIAKVVRTEVRQIHNKEYILAARLMGAKFSYSLWRHLLPNFMPSIMFMIIFNVSQAIAVEATLSFLGLGMTPGSMTWGSLMSMSQDALLTNSWWIIIIPSLFSISTLVCMTNIGEYLRKNY